MSSKKTKSEPPQGLTVKEENVMKLDGFRASGTGLSARLTRVGSTLARVLCGAGNIHEGNQENGRVQSR